MGLGQLVQGGPGAGSAPSQAAQQPDARLMAPACACCAWHHLPPPPRPHFSPFPARRSSSSARRRRRRRRRSWTRPSRRSCWRACRCRRGSCPAWGGEEGAGCTNRGGLGWQLGTKKARVAQGTLARQWRLGASLGSSMPLPWPRALPAGRRTADCPPPRAALTLCPRCCLDPARPYRAARTATSTTSRSGSTRRRWRRRRCRTRRRRRQRRRRRRRRRLRSMWRGMRRRRR